MEIFWENSQRLETVNYFRKKSSIVDIRLGSNLSKKIMKNSVKMH